MAGSTVRLRRQIPYAIAAEMLLAGEDLPAKRALELGLVNHVVPDGQALAKANEIAQRMADRMGGDARSLLLEVVGNRSSTAHILGGAIMGRTPEDGVCDELGRVFGYQNMYVCDGSLVPANLGVNPSLTITALSEYVMHHVSEKNGADRRPA